MSPLSLMLLDTLSHKKCDSRPGQQKTQTGIEIEKKKKATGEQVGRKMYLRDRNASKKELPCGQKNDSFQRKRPVLFLFFGFPGLHWRPGLDCQQQEANREPLSHSSTLPCQSHPCLVGMSLHQVRKISTSIPPLV